MNKVEIKDSQMDKVTGGYKAFNEGAIYRGICIKGIDIQNPESIRYYYIVVDGNIGSGVYKCKMWKTVDGTVTIANEDATLLLNNSNMIYDIEPNPPSFVSVV